MRVLILNSSVDTFEMLQEYFSFQGWETATCAMKPLREAQMTGAALMATYQPDVIVADLALPYEANWAAIQRLRNDPHATCPFVLTTTNEAAVRQLLGVQEPILELLGKPYDLTALRDAVLRAFRGEPAPSPPDTDRRNAERRRGDRRGQ
jgi:DNA-binding response OmpR family regulator